MKSKKHLKFALNDDNFLQLDFVLAAVKRRTKEEVEKAEQQLQLELSECADEYNEESEENGEEDDPDENPNYSTGDDIDYDL